MSKSIPHAYDPKIVEENCYLLWEEGGFFQAYPESEKPPYCIILPPPNVTGSLHMGHALVDTVQDVLIRWKRMQGYEALWIPGLDHAGISTQTVVEKHLIKTYGKRRKDFSREDFLNHIWSWKEQNEKQIISQLKKLGCSCDWSRQRFTMDRDSSQAVKTMFKKLYDQNLIYRGDYLVNWDPVTQTALADDEVEYEEIESFLWSFDYPLEDGSGSITIATTRPETMLGDTAVAVSPKDPRYKKHIGKQVRLPIVGRLIPIIEDNYVDPDFGTGAVKITPAHDPNDYEIGLRHQLEMINIMTPDGKINEKGLDFAGLSMQQARIAVVDFMKKAHLLKKATPHLSRVGLSYRSKAVIEPFLSKQWFVKMQPFKERLIEIVQNQEVDMIPKSFEKTYFHWIENLRDWCISRQLWWGHRIPIWYHKNNQDQIICHDGDGLPPQVQHNPDDWYQDEDVLDTWFSSALWPFSTLGWPKQTLELQKFYPTSVLVTGHDILFFWVARMILMGVLALDKIPFQKTFLHGLIYGKSYWRVDNEGSPHYLSIEEKAEYDMGQKVPSDIFSKWEKMSKSKGNVIDPLEMIDTYGADAIRMALLSSLTHARQIDLDRRRFEEYKNFSNKFWNSARFVFMNLIPDKDAEPLTLEKLSHGLNSHLLKIEDLWILSTFNQTILEVNKYLESFEFDKAIHVVYSFYWDKFCAYFIELSKPYLFGKIFTHQERENKQKLLAFILLGCLRLFHPFVPFITEELFQKFKQFYPNTSLPSEELDHYTRDFIQAMQSDACIISCFPQAQKEDISQNAEKSFEKISSLIYLIRNIRGDMQLPPSIKSDIYFIAQEDDPFAQLLKNNIHLVTSLVKIKDYFFVSQDPKLTFSSTAVFEGITILIALPQEMKHKETTRLKGQIEKLTQQINGLKSKLSNTSFLDKAPQALIKQTKSSLTHQEKTLQELESKLLKLQS